MLDHLFLFTDEAAAHAALDPLGFGYPARDDEDGTYPAFWDGSRVLPCRVIVGYDVRTITDPEMGTFEVQIPQYMPGFHLQAALMERRDDLIAMPECVLVVDREAAGVEGAVWSDFVIHTKVPRETMAAVREITPIFSGAVYPVGDAAAVSDLPPETTEPAPATE